MKVYLAHSISTKGENMDSRRVASEIRKKGYDTYAAAENNSINDKSNNPTPADIYHGDVSQIVAGDIFVGCLSGGLQDGTIFEFGLVSGLNERAKNASEVIPVVAYTSNARLMQPQFYCGISSAGANHLVLGGVDVWGIWVDTEEEMLEYLGDKNNIETLKKDIFDSLQERKGDK